MKTIVDHPDYGRLEYDSLTRKVSAPKAAALGRALGRMIKNPEGLGGDYYPNVFLQACKDLGVISDAEVRAGKIHVSSEDEFPPPEHAVY